MNSFLFLTLDQSFACPYSRLVINFYPSLEAFLFAIYGNYLRMGYWNWNQDPELSLRVMHKICSGKLDCLSMDSYIYM